VTVVVAVGEPSEPPCPGVVVLAIWAALVREVGKDWIGTQADASFVVDPRRAGRTRIGARTHAFADAMGIDDLFRTIVPRVTHSGIINITDSDRQL
jgi:hypothetical protein